MEARKKAAMGLKPCIAELVRTQFCPPSMVLVVQKIVEVPVHTPRGPKQAFRLMLTDGEKTIQATLVADLHWFVVIKEVAVGAFVVLDEYRLAKAMRKNKNGSVGYLQISELHTIGYVDGYDPTLSSKTSQLRGDNVTESEHEITGGDPSLSGRAKLETETASPLPPGRDNIVCFLGNDTEETNPPTKKAKHDIQVTIPHPHVKNVADGAGHGADGDDEWSEAGDARFGTGPTERSGRTQGPGPGYSEGPTSEGRGRPDTKSDEHVKVGSKNEKANISTVNEQTPPLASLEALPRSVYRRKIVEHWDRCHRVPFPQLLSPYRSSRTARETTNEHKSGTPSVDGITNEQVDTLFPQACMSLSQYAISTIGAGKFLKRINRPLDIVTLKGLAGLAQKQNRICGEQTSTVPSQLRAIPAYQPSDILAVVESPPTPIIKRSYLPPKCEITLSDPSTLKRITLSVFVDASNFMPAIGTVCLIRNVRNHRFNGQSLNAYPEDCEGWDWFIPNPEWAVPTEKMEWLRSWWAERLERRSKWGGCEVDESDNEFGYPAEKPPPRERVWGGSDDGDEDN